MDFSLICSSAFFCWEYWTSSYTWRIEQLTSFSLSCNDVQRKIVLSQPQPEEQPIGLIKLSGSFPWNRSRNVSKRNIMRFSCDSARQWIGVKFLLDIFFQLHLSRTSSFLSRAVDQLASLSRQESILTSFFCIFIYSALSFSWPVSLACRTDSLF